MKTLKILLIFIILLTLILAGYLFNQISSYAVYSRETINITKAVDGDTVDSEIGRIRMLGINTPEKNMPFYSEAKNFAMQLENKSIEVELYGKDKYDRTLAYLFLDNKMFNSEILKKGLANLYVYEKDEHFAELEQAEEYARNRELGIWKKSQNNGCLSLISLKFQEEERCHNQEQLVLENNCNSMSIILKDDANHIEKPNIETGNFAKNFSCIWNDAGDSMFIWDDSGLLLFYRYSGK